MRIVKEQSGWNAKDNQPYMNFKDQHNLKAKPFSASSIKSSLNPFDENLVYRIAARDGIDPAVLQAEWDRKGLEGRVYGRVVDSILTDVLSGQKTDLNKLLKESEYAFSDNFKLSINDLELIELRAINRKEELVNAGFRIEVQYIGAFYVGEKNSFVATQGDFLLINDKTKKIYLADTKADKTENLEKKAFNNMPFPLNEYPASTLWTYYFQIALSEIAFHRNNGIFYMENGEEINLQGYNVADLAIFHWNREEKHFFMKPAKISNRKHFIDTAFEYCEIFVEAKQRELFTKRLYDCKQCLELIDKYQCKLSSLKQVATEAEYDTIKGSLFGFILQEPYSYKTASFESDKIYLDNLIKTM